MKAPLILLALLALTVAGLAWFGASRTDMSLPVLPLPEQVGNFTGEDLLYCQNDACLRSFTREKLNQQRRCPVCGSALDSVALAEKRSLPGDTHLVKKRYTAPDGKSFFVSIVISGHERRSIHKPQVCLVGQGFNITGQQVLDIPVKDGPPHEVMCLHLTRGATETQGPNRSSYAYWFTDGTYETPYHITRLLLMARDNILRGVRRRWAYVAIASAATAAPDQDAAALRDFAGQLYPLVTRH